MLMRWWRAWRARWWGAGGPRLADLYVLAVDFPMSDPEQRARVAEGLAAVRREFPQLRFLVLEPGMTVTRFNDL